MSKCDYCTKYIQNVSYIPNTYWVILYPFVIENLFMYFIQRLCKSNITCLLIKPLQSLFLSIVDIYENGKSDNPLRSKYTKEIKHENIHRLINASLHQQCTSVLLICSLKIPLRPIIFFSYHINVRCCAKKSFPFKQSCM